MEQDQYVKVNIKESTRTKLKDQARTKGMTLADYIEWLGANVSAAPDEADALLDKLDKQSEEWHVDPLLEGLGPDELPECCQAFLKSEGYENCGHWEDRRPTGYLNKLTHKWSSDPSYYQYL